MTDHNPPATHNQTESDEDEIQILDDIPSHTRINTSKSPPRTKILPLNGSSRFRITASNQQKSVVPSHPYPRVHYNIAKNSVAHGDVIDPLDFPDTSSEKSNEDESSPLNPFSATRIFTVKHLKYYQNHSNPPYLSLSFEETRKEKLSQISPADRLRVIEREKELQKSFEDDCATHGYFAQCFILKNKSLEESLRNALNETLKDLETKYMKELDIYTDLFITKSSN
uniref:Uncharacterized protein n=1 Tax=Panagrolaimus sp. ES5 TaxID=591445 RepID=A0AC34FKD6_9BILA